MEIHKKSVNKNMQYRWFEFILSETIMIIVYCLLWILGFNPILLVGMLIQNQNIFICINSLVLSLFSTTIAYSILRWNQIATWLISLIGIMVMSFIIIEPYNLFCEKMFKVGIGIELQILIFNTFIQSLYIIEYRFLSKVNELI